MISSVIKNSGDSLSAVYFVSLYAFGLFPVYVPHCPNIDSCFLFHCFYDILNLLIAQIPDIPDIIQCYAAKILDCADAGAG